jgi:hypothetical protein
MTATRSELETELRERLLHAYGENVFISAHTKKVSKNCGNA